MYPALAEMLGDGGDNGQAWRSSCEALRASALLDSCARHSVAGEEWVRLY
eukprot:gene4293-5448_t